MADIIGAKVLHISFGAGVIKEVTESGGRRYVLIDFEDGKTSEFAYPGIFQTYISAEDAAIDSELKALAFAALEIENERAEIKKAKEREELAALRKRKERLSGNRKIKEDGNLAIRCTYCNGGETDTHFGFRDLCSDKVLKYNMVRGSRWCKDEKCPCRKHYLGIDAEGELVPGMCHESQLLINWEAEAGWFQEGDKKGTAKTLRRARKNGLCVLTTNDPNAKEDNRYIFALFLIDDFHEGGLLSSGKVESHSEYRLEFSKAEAQGFKFWNYYLNSNSPKKIVWNSGLIRYLDNEQAGQILRDATLIKKGTKDENIALKFFEYYCANAGIPGAESLRDKKGALMLPTDET